MAYALLRFTFGVNILVRGVMRIALGTSVFAAGMVKQFEGVRALPPAVVELFATVLPYVESLIGLCLVIGFQTKPALVAGSLMMAALTFGTMLRQDFNTAWLQLTYALIFFILLALRSWNAISIDAMMSSSHGGSDERA